MSKVADLVWDNDRNKFVAIYSGKLLCQSQNKYRVKEQIETGACEKAAAIGVTQIRDLTESDVPKAVMQIIGVRKEPEDSIKSPHFSVQKRFEFLNSFTDMVIRKESPALLISGGPGLGKTHDVTARFKAAGLMHSNNFLEEAAAAGTDVSEYGDLVIIKGHSSARGMYDTLYRYRDKYVIFDDVVKVLEDKVAVDILKAVLDSTDRRFVNWDARVIGKSDIPNNFEFTGGVIFITNKDITEIDEALRTRCLLKVNLHMDLEERIERIRHVMPSMVPTMDMDMKEEVMNFLVKYKEVCPGMNLRTFIAAAMLRKVQPTNWEESALYTISN